MRPIGLLAVVLASLSLSLPAHADGFDLWFSQPESTAKTNGARAKPARSTSASRASLRPASARLPARELKADRIVVKKGERRLYLMRDDRVLRSYRVSLGYTPVGHKRMKGDGRTPEGRYFIDRRNAGSHYYKALGISYPNSTDRLAAMRKGYDPGGAIMIHGQPSGRRTVRRGDWTFGCIAVSNMAIDEIWERTRLGTPIEIVP